MGETINLPREFQQLDRLLVSMMIVDHFESMLDSHHHGIDTDVDDGDDFLRYESDVIENLNANNDDDDVDLNQYRFRWMMIE